MADSTGFNWSNFLNVAIPAAATGVAGYLGYKGATGAAQTQATAATDALDFQKQMFATQQANLQPYLGTGRVALNALLQGMGLAPFQGAAPGAGAGPGGAVAPFAQDSPFGSKLLGNLTGTAPSAVKSGLTGAAAGAGLGATVGSVVPGVGTAIGAGVGAAAGTLSSLVGTGRKQADQLVPIQNSVAAEVDRITKAVNAAQQNGTLTKEQLQEAHDTVTGLQTQFGDVAKKFDKAGPGGVATLAKYFDPLTQGWQNQLQGQAGDQQWNLAPSQAPQTAAPGGNSPGGPGVPGAPGATQDTSGPAFGSLNKPFSTSDFVQDPGYQARLDEGQKQLDRFFASRGLASSGGAAKSAGRYGQTFASNEFQNVYNRYQQQQQNSFSRLATLAGLGQNSTGTSASLASNLAQSGAGLITDVGAATAAGQVGAANAVTGAVTGGANLFNQSMQLNQIQNYLKQNQLPTTAPYNGPIAQPGDPNFVGPVQ